MASQSFKWQVPLYTHVPIPFPPKQYHIGLEMITLTENIHPDGGIHHICMFPPVKGTELWISTQRRNYNLNTVASFITPPLKKRDKVFSYEIPNIAFYDMDLEFPIDANVSMFNSDGEQYYTQGLCIFRLYERR